MSRNGKLPLSPRKLWHFGIAYCFLVCWQEHTLSLQRAEARWSATQAIMGLSGTVRYPEPLHFHAFHQNILKMQKEKKRKERKKKTKEKKTVWIIFHAMI